jgi:PBSX family phage portal protein
MSNAKKDVKPEPKVSYVQKVIKGDTYLVMADSALELEDEFSNFYWTDKHSSNLFLCPPYEPKVLARLVTQNNILSQCIEAMEVNIDSTGYELVNVDDTKDVDQKEKEIIDGFFGEPYPGKSYQSIRRKFRRDLESTGYAFLEVLRAVSGDLVGFRNLESTTVRLVKLDDPVEVKKKITRNGKEIELTMMERERRFGVLYMAARKVYFREYGTTRQLNKHTGEWESPDNPVALEDRATELLFFNVNPDPTSPYGVPRWINQLPSVIGSRKAEEHNLEYFDAGGMPPALIFVQGGTLAGDAADQLRNYLSGKNKNRNRAVVVEAQSSSGSLDAAGTVKVTVERFGAEMANDAMFQNYDKNTEDHIRKSFRLPPLFIGDSAEHNFATAVVSYMVAEAQVFSPERVEFDEVINKTILKELGIKNTKIKSKGITMKNAADQVAALPLVQTMVKPEDFVAAVNDITGLTLNYDTEAAKAQAAADQQTNANSQQMHDKTIERMDIQNQQLKQGGPVKVPKPSQSGGGALSDPSPGVKSELLELARKYCGIQGLLALKHEMSPEEEMGVADAIEKMDRDTLREFQTMVANFVFESGHSHLCSH